MRSSWVWAPVKVAADALYDTLKAAGFETLFDDRNRKAGFMFADADLIGVPFRVVVSPRNLKDGVVELRLKSDMLEAAIVSGAVEVVSAASPGIAEAGKDLALGNIRRSNRRSLVFRGQ